LARAQKRAGKKCCVMFITEKEMLTNAKIIS